MGALFIHGPYQQDKDKGQASPAAMSSTDAADKLRDVCVA